MKNKIVASILLFTGVSLCFAEDFGKMGKTYPIAEPDMISWIKGKANTMMQNGEWDQIQKQAIANAKNQVQNPPSIPGISDANQTKTWYYTPIVNVNHDIKDTRGYVIAKAGTYNALRYKPMDTQLLFINGNNKKQVKWALNYLNQNGVKGKIVLTQGSYLDLDKEHKVWFYYDQGGKYTQKLNITHVPALVMQDGTRLKITEYSNNEI